MLDILGPVQNIQSSLDNCTSVIVTWNSQYEDYNRTSILYYYIRIYDDITGSLVDTVSVYDTSYQFVDNNLFIHRYTYVITGVNELGEGIPNNKTFSYLRGNHTLLYSSFVMLHVVPRSATENTSIDILVSTQDVIIVQFNIPV